METGAWGLDVGASNPRVNNHSGSVDDLCTAVVVCDGSDWRGPGTVLAWPTRGI